MAWFKKTRKPIAAEGKAEPRAGRPVGQVSRLLAGHLQQGSRGQPERLPEVRAPLPRRRRRAAAHAVRRRRGPSTTAISRRPIRCNFTDTKPYKARLEAGVEATGLKDAVIVALGRHRRHRDDRGGAGIRVHRRQHGRGRRREDHARASSARSTARARWSSSAVRAARG